MVYNGTPSRACAGCRRRKLRCDLRRDSCGQCIRAGLSCTGYRDPTQLRIRDESETTKKKALKLSAPSLRPSVQSPILDKARYAFIAHYVYGFSRSYDVLERIGPVNSFEPHLASSLDAVSLAFFSYQYNIMTVSKLTQERYLHALPLVNEALATAKYRVSNSTLLAILFLDLFEKIVNRSPKSSRAWMSHVNGALALFRLREPSQLATYVGRRLSVRLFTNTLISCVAADTALPQALKDLHVELQSHVGRDDPKWRVSGLVMKYADFRGAVQKGLLSSYEILAGAKALDKEFDSLNKNFPPSWDFHRVDLPKPCPLALEEHYDVYPSNFATQTRNVIRTMRIYLNSLIRGQYLELASARIDTDRNIMNAGFASHVTNAMAQEICASGPQFMLSLQRHNPIKPVEDTQLERLHCHTLIFPFYVAAYQAGVDSRIRVWVIRQLRHIAVSCQIRNADLVADILEENRDREPWDVYAMLGGYAFAA